MSEQPQPNPEKPRGKALKQKQPVKDWIPRDKNRIGKSRKK